MDLSKINTLNIIKKNKDPLVNKSITPNTNVISGGSKNSSLNGETKEPTNLTTITPGTKVKKLYGEFRKGLITKENLDKKLLSIKPLIMEKVDIDARKEANIILLETLKWLIKLKILISTGKNPNKKILEFSETINNIITDDNILGNLDILHSDPKRFSKEVYNFLKLFTSDDLINPKFKVDLSGYLTNVRPNFLKEIAVLFDLYSKYYETISNELINNLEKVEQESSGSNKINVKFKKLPDIQPRFDMINKHIFASNLIEQVDYNLDLEKIGVLPEDPYEASKILGISASQLGLKKRLDYLNAWLINGIVMVQVSINRLYALKPISLDKPNSIPGLNLAASKSVNEIYDVWLILEDTKSFLESLKGLIDGRAFITGVPSENMLDILNTNY